MSQIPTFQSVGNVPRPSGQGAQAIAGAVGDVGGQLGNLALALRATQRQIDLSHSRARIIEGMDQAALEAERMSDPAQAENAFDSAIGKLRENELKLAGSDRHLVADVDSFVTERASFRKIEVRRAIVGRTIANAGLATDDLEQALLLRVKRGGLPDDDMQRLSQMFAQSIEAQVGLVHTPESAQARIALFEQKLQDANETRLTATVETGANAILSSRTTMSQASNALMELASDAIAGGLPVDDTVKSVVNSVIGQVIEDENIAKLGVLDRVMVNGRKLADYQFARDERDRALQEVSSRVIDRDKAAVTRQKMIDDERIRMLQSKGVTRLRNDPLADTRDIENELSVIDPAAYREFLNLKPIIRNQNDVVDDPEVVQELSIQVLNPTDTTNREIIQNVVAGRLSPQTANSLIDRAEASRTMLSKDPIMRDAGIRQALDNAEADVVRGITGSGINLSQESNIAAGRARYDLWLYVRGLREKQPNMDPSEFTDLVRERVEVLLKKYNPRGVERADRGEIRSVDQEAAANRPNVTH